MRQSNGLSLQMYSVLITSEINGVSYGYQNTSTASCGSFKPFVFSPVSTCMHPSAVHGCMEVTACNYDYLATCDDGSCFYTTQTYWENLDPGNVACTPCDMGTGGSACNPAVATCSGSFANGTLFTSETDCNNALGIQ